MTTSTAAAPHQSLTLTPAQSQQALEIYQGQHSTLILIIGKSGRGKSTSIRTLPPEQTHIINVKGKELPFPDAAKYVLGKNLTTEAGGPQIRELMKRLAGDASINYLVADDVHYIMATEFMDKVMIKGYDKFSVMARNMWDLLVQANQLRPGLKIFMTAHEEETQTERKMKTMGKLLDEKLTPEGLSTIVLWAEVEMVDKKTPRFYFATQTDGQTNAKAPMGMFPPEIPNDLLLVARRIDEYYKGVPLEKSRIIR